MRKLLLGTTALIAAGAVGAGEARAEFEATVNGNYYAAWGFVNQDDDTGDPGNTLQNQAINEDFEVHLRISQVADNGLTFKGRSLSNWWEFMGDFDQAVRRKTKLTE